MARKSTKKEQITVVDEPSQFKRFEVIVKFKGFVNDVNFDCKVGDIIELTDFQASVYKRFIKEVTQ